MFVVTEVLQTQKEVEVTRTHKQEGSGQFVLPGAVGLQVWRRSCSGQRPGRQEGGAPRQTLATTPSPRPALQPSAWS